MSDGPTHQAFHFLFVRYFLPTTGHFLLRMVGVRVLAVRCSASTLTSAPLWCADKKVGARRSHSDKLAPKASRLFRRLRSESSRHVWGRHLVGRRRLVGQWRLIHLDTVVLFYLFVCVFLSFA